MSAQRRHEACHTSDCAEAEYITTSASWILISGQYLSLEVNCEAKKSFLMYSVMLHFYRVVFMPDKVQFWGGNHFVIKKISNFKSEKASFRLNPTLRGKNHRIFF